jgi:predicted metal-binding protein
VDNNSTNLIIFNEPNFEEHILINNSGQELSFSKYDQRSKNSLGDPSVVSKSESRTFVWNYRDKLIKRIQICIQDQKNVISLDKLISSQTQNKINQKGKLFKSKGFVFFYSLELNT